PPPRTSAVLSPRPRRLLPLLAVRGLVPGPSNWTTFPIEQVIMATARADQAPLPCPASVFLGRSAVLAFERMTMRRHRGVIATALLAAGLALPAASAHARPSGPDRAFRTPVAHGAAAARTAVSRSKLAVGLGKLFRRVGKSGAFVFDPGTHQV